MLQIALATALAGHWLANALFDRDEYAGASPDVVGRLHDPAVFQTVLAALAVAGLALWERRRRRRGSDPLLATVGGSRLVAILVGAQLLLFVGLEASERIAIEVLSSETTNVKALGVGFIAEFLVAMVAALVVSVLGATTAHIVKILRHCRQTPVRESWKGSPTTPFVPGRRGFFGSGGVRAPPVPSS